MNWLRDLYLFRILFIEKIDRSGKVISSEVMSPDDTSTGWNQDITKLDVSEVFQDWQNYHLNSGKLHTFDGGIVELPECPGFKEKRREVQMLHYIESVSYGREYRTIFTEIAFCVEHYSSYGINDLVYRRIGVDVNEDYISKYDVVKAFGLSVEKEANDIPDEDEEEPGWHLQVTYNGRRRKNG